MQQTVDIDNVKLSGQVTDRIGDMLARIRNGLNARHDEVAIPATKILKSIARIMKREGYIADFEVREGTFCEVLVVKLRYDNDGHPIITGMRRVSKPGRRVYVPQNELPRIMGGMGISIVTTSHGVITSKEAAGRGVGGEVLCNIW